MDVKRKTFSGAWELKDEDRGEVEAAVASLDVPDRDGDLFAPGSFRPSPVALSFWGHDTVTADAPPVGAGTIHEDGRRAVFKGRFFLATTRGKEAFETLKGMGDGARWSFGFPRGTAESRDPTPAESRLGARKVYTAVHPVEASPVLQPAGHGTGTLALRSMQTAALRDAASLAALKSIMGEQEIPHEAVAGEMGVSVGEFREILSGERPLPRLSELRAVREPIQRKSPEEIDREYRAHRARFDALHGPRDGVEVPRGVRKVAEHGAEWAAKQWGVPTPRVVFFRREDYGDGSSGYFRKSNPDVIHLRGDLDAGELFRIALHEVSHYARNRKGIENTEDAVDGDTRNLLNQYRQEATNAWARKTASSAELFRY